MLVPDLLKAQRSPEGLLRLSPASKLGQECSLCPFYCSFICFMNTDQVLLGVKACARYLHYKSVQDRMSLPLSF